MCCRSKHSHCAFDFNFCFLESSLGELEGEKWSTHHQRGGTSNPDLPQYGFCYLLSRVLVLLIYCCITNYKKLKRLKTLICDLTASVGHESGQSLHGPSTSGSLTSCCNQGVGWAAVILRLNWGRICFQAHVVVGKIQFLEV